MSNAEEEKKGKNPLLDRFLRAEKPFRGLKKKILLGCSCPWPAFCPPPSSLRVRNPGDTEMGLGALSLVPSRRDGDQSLSLEKCNLR